jgi:HSP20 family protein
MLWRTDPWRELERVRRNMDSLFAGSSVPGPGRSFPLINVYEDTDNVLVAAELPGFTKEDINITFSDTSLSIAGTRKPLKGAEGMTAVRRERSLGEFEKSFTVPCKVEQDKISATFTDGILTVTLPKCEETKPKHINIEAK